MSLAALFDATFARMQATAPFVELEGARARMTVYCDSTELAASVGSFMDVYFKPREPTTDFGARAVNVAVTSSEDFFRMVDQRVCSADARDGLEVVSRSDEDEGLVAHIIFRTHRPRILIVVNGQGVKAQMATVRAARALFWELMSIQDAYYLHAACVTSDLGGIAITGDKWAGKTTTLLNLLSQGWHYVSNDKIAVRSNGATPVEVEAVGFPTHAGIRRGTFHAFNGRFPDALRERMAARWEQPSPQRDDRVYFSHRELADAFGVQVYPSCPVRMFLVPKFDAEVATPTFERVSTCAAVGLLSGQELQGMDQIASDLLFLERTIPLEWRTGDMPGMERASRGTRQRTATIPCFVVRQNGNTNPQLGRLLRDLLASETNTAQAPQTEERAG